MNYNFFIGKEFYYYFSLLYFVYDRMWYFLKMAYVPMLEHMI